MVHGRSKAGRKRSSFPVPALPLHFKLELRPWSGFRLSEFWFWFSSSLAGGPWAYYLSPLCSNFFIWRMDLITVPQSVVVMRYEVILTKGLRIVPDIVNRQWILTITSFIRILELKVSHLTVLDLSFLNNQMKELGFSFILIKLKTTLFWNLNVSFAFGDLSSDVGNWMNCTMGINWMRFQRKGYWEESFCEGGRRGGGSVWFVLTCLGS